MYVIKTFELELFLSKSVPIGRRIVMTVQKINEVKVVSLFRRKKPGVEGVVQTIERRGDQERVVEEKEAINDYEILERRKFGHGTSAAKVIFNGRVLEIGQRVISNGRKEGFPRGTPITLDLFDAGGDVFVSEVCQWLFGNTDDGLRFQGDPFDFEGYEDTRRHKHK